MFKCLLQRMSINDEIDIYTECSSIVCEMSIKYKLKPGQSYTANIACINPHRLATFFVYFKISYGQILNYSLLVTCSDEHISSR